MEKESFQLLFTEFINELRPCSHEGFVIAMPEKYNVFSKGTGFQELKESFVSWYSEVDMICDFNDEWILNEIYMSWGLMTAQDADERQSILKNWQCLDYSNASVLETVKINMKEINNKGE